MIVGKPDYGLNGTRTAIRSQKAFTRARMSVMVNGNSGIVMVNWLALEYIEVGVVMDYGCSGMRLVTRFTSVNIES